MGLSGSDHTSAWSQSLLSTIMEKLPNYEGFGFLLASWSWVYKTVADS